ncbi:uncharacterized protein LOC133726396 isoform X2 [Rosa rugosa]|uniref:uncharacterized protein LOC133726396 isoform X2 n=1 Tax=Rosa rugosa TaxID=74645 RepID=UPI002B40CFB2|nr:uncharacterized protein LOC133726396 isoform X2 [Rosa rugosa]
MVVRNLEGAAKVVEVLEEGIRNIITDAQDTDERRVEQVFENVDEGESDIPWEDLVIGERIGLGNFSFSFSRVVVLEFFFYFDSGIVGICCKWSINTNYIWKSQSLIYQRGLINASGDVGQFIEGWTLYEILKYVPEHNWIVYEQALQANPVLAKMVISQVAIQVHNRNVVLVLP